jgi:hypothetical protein
VNCSASDIADIFVAIFTALSLLVAAWAFFRDARIREFELCTRLSENIEALWKALDESGISTNAYASRFILILNHYERCACYLNEVRLLTGRPAKILRDQILEVLHRNWSDADFQKTFRSACTGPTTFFELRELMTRSRRFEQL